MKKLNKEHIKTILVYVAFTIPICLFGIALMISAVNRAINDNDLLTNIWGYIVGFIFGLATNMIAFLCVPNLANK